MKKQSHHSVIILGATGGCVDILTTIHQINATADESVLECCGFLDDNPELASQQVLGVPIIGPFSAALNFVSSCLFVTGIGNSANFWKRCGVISSLGLKWDNFAIVIHPSACVSDSGYVGPGSVLHQNVVIMTNACVGKCVLVSPNAVISHDAIVGDYTIINTGVIISGNVHIGNSCYFGPNSVIRDHVTIGEGCLIGMGSVVLDDVPDYSVVVGHPAQRIRDSREDAES